jgi:aspartyl-tRNA(Asn)/glutamyl-tRNA(Gln) amidotransferase subunit B
MMLFFNFEKEGCSCNMGLMKEYELTVGLEVHAELKTHTKMFCACKNNPDEKEPNVNTCPICMGHPGTLPTLNRRLLSLL